MSINKHNRMMLTT